MNLRKLKNSSDDLHADWSDVTLDAFMDCLNEVPSIIAKSKETYYTKLVQVKRTGLFDDLNMLLTKSISVSIQLKILKLWDFMVQSCSTPDEVNLLFQESVATNLIQFPWDFSTIDLLRSYVSVLKGISLKFNVINPKYLFCEERGICPIYASVIYFIGYNDSITISAARLVVLNLCLLKNREIMDYISVKTPKHTFEKLIESNDSDKFAFLSDLFQVAPVGLTNQVLQILMAKMEQFANDMEFLGKCLQFLCDCPARTTISQYISKNLDSIPLNPCGLGVILFALEKKLIYLDYAIRSGLVVNLPKIKRFGGDAPMPKSGAMLERLAGVFEQRISVVHTALILRIFQMLYEKPPSCVFKLLKTVIDQILQISGPALMETFLVPFEWRQRCDLDFLYTYTAERTGEPQELVSELCEVQAALKRWKKQPFAWFNFDDVVFKADSEVFLTADQMNLSLTDNEVTFQDGEVAKLSRMYIESRHKRTVDIVIIKGEVGRNRFSLPLKTEMSITFAQANTAAAFEAKVSEFQHEIVKKTLYSLLEEEDVTCA